MAEQTSLPLHRNSDYRLWWLGNLVSSIGTQMSLIALPLLVLLNSGSPFQAGLIASFEALPFAFFSLPVGVIVDRVSHRALLAGSAALGLVAMTALAVAYATGNLASWLIFAVAFLNGIASVVYAITQMATLPALIEEHQIGAATVQAETIERLAAIAGPPVAALLFDAVWPGMPFVVDALSFGVIVLCVLSLRSPLGPKPPFPPFSLRSDFTAGAKVIAHQPLLRDLTILNVAGDFLFAGIGLLMIVLVRDAGAEGSEVGLVFSAAAVGGVIGASITNHVEARIGLTQAVVGKHVLTAAIFPLLALDLPPLAIGLLWGTISFQVSILNVIQRKYQLHITPQDMMGRVQSFVTFLSFGSLPLGTAATGYLLEAVGTRGTVLVYTGVLILLAGYSILSRSIRAGSILPQLRSMTSVDHYSDKGTP